MSEKCPELEELRNKVLQGKMIRSRAKWIAEGDKRSNDVCNLEHRNFVSKVMNKLYNTNGILLSDQNEILEETLNHYKSLYAQREVKNVEFEDSLQANNVPKQKEFLENELTYTEMLDCFSHYQQMKMNLSSFHLC